MAYFAKGYLGLLTNIYDGDFFSKIVNNFTLPQVNSNSEKSVVCVLGFAESTEVGGTEETRNPLLFKNYLQVPLLAPESCGK